MTYLQELQGTRLGQCGEELRSDVLTGAIGDQVGQCGEKPKSDVLIGAPGDQVGAVWGGTQQ